MRPDYFFNLTRLLIILDKEVWWFDRGVRESVWERVEQPAINKKGGLCFQLSHAWDSAIRCHNIKRRRPLVLHVEARVSTCLHVFI